jgi:hypothetical protein
MSALKNTYPLVERFALVYLVGISLSLLAPIYLKFRTPAFYPQALLALAAFLAILAFVRRQGRAPGLAEYVLALAGCAALLLGVKFYLAAKFADAAGMGGAELRASMMRRTLWESLLLAVLFSPWLARTLARSAPAHRKQPAARPGPAPAPATNRSQPKEPPAAATGTPKIPAGIAFVSIGSTRFEEARGADARMLAPLFRQSLAPEPGKVAKAQVLFLYADLQPDGTIQGLEQRVGIRQVVQATEAAIVVVASANDPEAVQAAIALPGPRTANLVFTLDRGGERLPRFFARLFGEMRDGTDMMAAWVKLCPQGPAAAAPDMPATLFLAEGGKLAFPPAA